MQKENERAVSPQPPSIVWKNNVKIRKYHSGGENRPRGIPLQK